MSQNQARRDSMRSSDGPADPATRRFAGLDPDTVFAAVEDAGLKPTGLFQALNSLENRVFSVEVEAEGLAPLLEPLPSRLAAASQNDRVVVKVYRPGRWNRDQIGEEHSFLAELAAEGLPVIRPLAAFRDGATLGDTDGMPVALWPSIVGRIPDDCSDSQLAEFGELLARVHTVGARSTFAGRPEFEADRLIREPLDWLERSGRIAPRCRERYTAAALAAADGLDRALRGLPVQRIHGDCHWGNLVARPDGLWLLDFDDCGTGPSVQDLWMMAPAADTHGERQRRIVLDAYRMHREFPEAWLAAANPLRAGRYVHYAAWIARRWDDPSFPKAFPHFADEEYWEAETRDLERLVRDGFAPDDDGRPALPTEDWSHLTNKDYFWDM